MYSETSIQMEIGHPPSQIIFTIDLKTPFSYIFPQNYPTWIFKSFRYIRETNVTFPTRNKPEIIPSKESYTSLSLPKPSSSTLNDFFLFLLNKPLTSYPNNDSISLSFYPLNKEYKYSLIYQLYEQGLITSKSFAYYNDNNKRYISLGSLPNKHIHTQLLYKGKCSVLPKETEWTCRIKSIVIDVEYLNSTSSVYFWNNLEGTRFLSYFQLSHKEILIPQKHFSEISSNVFRKYINQKQCRFTSMNSDKIVCLNSFLNDFQFNLKFEYENMIMVLTKEMLFEQITKNESMFLLFPNMVLPDNWELGVDFMKHFNIVFDYENYAVYFYSDVIEIKTEGGVFDKVIKQNDNNIKSTLIKIKEIKIVLFISMISVMCVFIIILYIMKKQI
jgi:hypothetical protein